MRVVCKMRVMTRLGSSVARWHSTPIVSKTSLYILLMMSKSVFWIPSSSRTINVIHLDLVFSVFWPSTQPSAKWNSNKWKSLKLHILPFPLNPLLGITTNAEFQNRGIWMTIIYFSYTQKVRFCTVQTFTLLQCANQILTYLNAKILRQWKFLHWCK